MTDIADLNEQEKIFLAGAIKVLILADGVPSPEELDELDAIVEGLGFSDFDEHLERFEKDVISDQDFEFLARNIYHEGPKSLITRILWEIALQKGFASPEDEKLIQNIRTWWQQ